MADERLRRSVVFPAYSVTPGLFRGPPRRERKASSQACLLAAERTSDRVGTSAKHRMCPGGGRGPVGRALIMTYSDFPNWAPAFAGVYARVSGPTFAEISNESVVTDLAGRPIAPRHHCPWFAGDRSPLSALTNPPPPVRAPHVDAGRPAWAGAGESLFTRRPPKEQPPRNLSGKRDRALPYRHSGKRSFEEPPKG